MKRENFKKIIKLRSFWKIDKRRGNYVLLCGDKKLSDYVETLVSTQLKLDSLGISSDGDIYSMVKFGDKLTIMSPDYNEDTNEDEQEERRNKLVFELIY